MNEFSVGSVISRSFSIWLKNIIPFTLLTALVYVPLILYTWSAISEGLTLDNLQTWERVSMLSSSVLGPLATAAVTYGVIQQLRGRHASLVDCTVVGLQRMFPVILVAVLVGICVALGLIALIIPGIIVMLMLYVAVPVAVIEKPGIVASLSRSNELTKGYKGSIFGILLVFVGIGIVYHLIFGISPNDKSITLDDVENSMMTSVVFSIISGGLGSTVAAVVYHDLRAVKEGVDVEELAKVFE